MKRLLTIAAAALAMSGIVGIASAQESGALIDQLVKKGVLSDQEGEEIRAELLKEFSSTPAGKLDYKSWVNKMTLFGDLRLRYEYVDRQDAFDDRERVSATEGNRTIQDDVRRDDISRVRYRLRFGMKAEIQENLEFGIRLATAQSSVDSRNETFGDMFATDPVEVDLAYLKYQPRDFVTLWGGKMPTEQLIYTTDMYWDSDISVEGAAQQFTYKATDKLKLFLNVGQWVYQDENEADEDTSAAGDGYNAVRNDDGWLFFAQGGGQFDFEKKKHYAKLGVGYWYWANSGDVSANEPGGGSNIGREFQIFDVLGEYNITPELMGKPLPIKLYGHFAINTAPAPDAGVFDDGDDSTVRGNNVGNFSNTRRNGRRWNDISDDTAWRVGAKFGNAKEKGDWELNAFYQEMGSDALPANVIDSDIAGGDPNHAGYGIKAKYMFRDWWEFGISYLDFEIEDPDVQQDANINVQNQNRTLQVDTVVKF